MRVRYGRLNLPKLALLLLVALGFSVGLHVFPTSHAVAQALADDATRAAARQLGEEGIEAYWAEDFASADEKLDKAYRLFATPTLALWSARAHVRTGHWVEAAERLRDATRSSRAVGDGAAQKQAQLDATKELIKLVPRIPSLIIQLEAADPDQVQLTLDGQAIPSALVGVPRPTNPGAHQVVATRGAERLETQVQLVEKEHRVAAFRFQAAPMKAQQPVAAAVLLGERSEAPGTMQLTAANTTPQGEGTQRNLLVPAAIAALSLGGIGLVASGALALAADGKHSDCPGDVCKTSGAKSAYDSLRTASTASFYLGAVFAAGGLVTFWVASTSSSQKQEPRVSWGFGPSGVAFHGEF